MRPNRWFTRPNPILSYLRIAIAGALLIAAAGMAFLAAKTSGPTTAPNPLDSRTFLTAIKKGDADSFKPGKNEEAVIGPNEVRGPDFSPNVEAYLQRAYPANEIPMKLTIKAQNGWAAFVNASGKVSAGAKASSSASFVNASAKVSESAKASSSAAASSSSLSAWQLIGPSKATYPGILNQLGDQAAYIASGRITALAVAKTCVAGNCRIYVGAAGGGIWRTPDGFSDTPVWEFVSNSFATNAIGSFIIDPNVASGNTVYAGTGEPNVSVDSEAGMGIYKSTDGGTTWTLLPGSAQFQGRAVASLAITPNGAILAGIARAVRGVSSTDGGATSNPPIAVGFGVYRSTDAGATFQDISGPLGGTVRGINEVRVDPSNCGSPGSCGNIAYYAAAFQTGVWRTTDAGATWVQIKTPTNAADNSNRSEFTLALRPGNLTRMYVGIGGAAGPAARFFSTQNSDVFFASNATFIDQTTAQNIDYCTGQCWYDNTLYSPPGFPDVVYLLGSFSYSQLGGLSNGRAVLLSTDGGNNWSDLTQDGRPPPQHHEFTHPDNHAIVVNPNNPFQYWDGNDGGIVRSNGQFADISFKCDERGLNPADNAYCKNLLSRVPQKLTSLNTGLSTLQFQSLSTGNFRALGNKKGGKSTVTVQGGTQDNGTFQYVGLTDVWPQIIYGDGGQSGFSSTAEARRFNTFSGQAHDVNFRSGDPTAWCVASAPIISSPESSFFYPPIIADPHTANAGQIFEGSFSVWRTQDWAGDQATLEADCPEFFTSAAQPGCGDFVRIGSPFTDLGDPGYGNRAGSAVAWIERNASNTGTIWAATGAGRVFFSSNSNANPPSAVAWERLDQSSAASPGRFITGIASVPSNTNIAIVSYSGYNYFTPAQPGHVFVVTRTGASTATWSDFTFNLPDLPITGVVLDTASPISPTGLVIYASSDFGVMRYVDGSGVWTLAGTGLPQVEVAGLTIVPPERRLYAATHGRSAWLLQLPGGDIR